MGYFRFRRSVKILPGIRLNIGKRGVSTSIGVRGAHLTIGKTGTRTTVGLPGSGLSYTHLEKPHQPHQDAPGEAPTPPVRSHVWVFKFLLLLGLLALLVHFLRTLH